MKKFLLFGLMAAVLPAVAEETADRKTATSLKYVTHELETRQNKFTAEQNKAMEYTNTAGAVEKRTVKSDLGSDTSDTSLPMVGGVNVKLNMKQDDIAAVNDHTAVTYTGTAGAIGRKGIYQTSESYAAQSDNLIDAKTFNAALKNGLDSEFKCSDNRQPDTDICWLWEIHNNNTEYVSATGTVTQDGIPTPTNPIDPVFYRQGNMVLRKVGNYADSYDATTHKITRRVGINVFAGTENWEIQTVDGRRQFFILSNNTIPYNNTPTACSHFHSVLARSSDQVYNQQMALFCKAANGAQPTKMVFEYDEISTLQNWQSFIAAQYAAGTPVTVYYPLATPVEEDWTETTYNENVYIPQNQ